jgi:tetratricopeptide (TPR) repeat protein
MRSMRKWLGCSVALLAIASLSLLLSSPALAQPRPMEMDVYTPIAKGYDLMRAGNYEAAQYEFETALKKDRFNPFALNNLAALMEKQGKMKDAMAFLTDAQTHAGKYFDKVEQTCFVGGLCAGVKPVQAVGPTSSIAPVIAENMKKLQAKMAATPTKPEPSTPPPMEEKKK